MYQPFPIYDLKSGLVLSQEPWLLPGDAFQAMLNARLRRGVLEKRAGYEVFARIGHSVADEPIGASGGTSYSGTLIKKPLRAGELQFSDGTLTIADNGDGTLSGNGSGTINYDTGAYSITFSSSTTGAVTADYVFFPGLPVVGIIGFQQDDGSQETLFFDTKRMVKWDSANSKTIDVAKANTWTGDDFHFVQASAWNGSLFIANNKDRLKSYNGLAVANVMVDIDNDTLNELDSCKFVFLYKSRLVLLSTKEDSISHPQRARWCAVNTPTNWTNDEYVDAPTNEWIVTAGFIGEDLVVWFDSSVWLLKYTGNTDLPFVWERVPSDYGAQSPFGMVSFKAGEQAAYGPYSFNITDKLNVAPFDGKVPDAALDVGQEKTKYVYAGLCRESKEAWWLCPSIASASSDQVLAFNWQEATWSKFDIAMQVLGETKSVDSDPTWNAMDVTWDEVEMTWDDRSGQAGYPVVLMGDGQGYIHRANRGGADNGAAIAFEVISGEWNPFWKAGRCARLGWVDFLIDADSGISLGVEFFMGHESAPYQMSVLDFSPDGTESKAWKRVYCGAEAESHRIRLIHTASNQTLRIHAVVPFFAQGGRLG